MRCKRWGVAPKAGGLEDQPIEILQMEQLESIYRTFVAVNNAKDLPTFIENYPDTYDFYVQIDKLRDGEEGG